MVYTAKIPWIIKKIFPSLIFTINNDEKVLYITFDDGPNPQTSEFILKILETYNAKATFFCLGKNIKNHPELYKKIKSKGHATGNHTHNHINGWKVSNNDYFKNIEKAKQYINSNLFRPPYGKIKYSQARYLSKKYKIIMWDVISGDFDKNTSEERCYKNVMNNVKSGSIIVFHDSLKAKDKVLNVLPRVLKELSEQGYKFHKIKALDL